MKTMLHCDITLGGSTTQYLKWCKNNLGKKDFISSLEKKIMYRAKTKPALVGKRTAALIGVTYDQLNGDEHVLECIMKAIHNLNRTQ